MSRAFAGLVFGGLLMLAACSDREQAPAEEADGWDAIQALEDNAAPVPVVEVQTNVIEAVVEEPVASEPAVDYSGYIERLDALKTRRRAEGETLLTGRNLVFEYDQREVRLMDRVQVVDDRGVLKTDELAARFSASNAVEFVEARRNVEIVADGRRARAGHAVYNYASGMVQLDDRAAVEDGDNRLAGERIQLWVKDNRKMICEPNAVLEITMPSESTDDGTAPAVERVEIRAGRVVFDEDQARVVLNDAVKVRSPKVAMDCETIQLHLKDENEIDWIEALSEVIIQSEDRKALADRAVYYAGEGKFELEGDPKVKQGDNIMTGDRITFWQKTRRMVCEPNARLLLFVDDETRAKFLKDLND